MPPAEPLVIPSLVGTLRHFQEDGVRYALDKQRIIFGDEQGLGKSIEALASLEAAGAYPAVIVCPASLKLDWERKVKEWLPHRTVEIVSGVTESDICIVNYDQLKKWWDPLSARRWKACVLDESHYIKNDKAQRSMRASWLARRCDYRFLLTGTPVLNRPIEVVNQLVALDRIQEFGGFWPFVRRYCRAYKGMYGWDFSGSAHLDELNTKLREMCYIRRKKSEVLTELPPKVRTVIPLEIDNRVEYARVELDVVGWVARRALEKEQFKKSLTGLPKDVARKMQEAEYQSAQYKAKQAEHLVRIEALKQVAAKGKLKSVTEWISDFLESGEKLVVFAHHKEIQSELAKAFPGCAKLTGDMSSLDRQANVDLFQNDERVKLMVCSLQAGGVGITLTAASNVAFVELGWTPAAHDQAEDRVHRIGQLESVNVWYLLAAGTIDEDIAQLLDSKRVVVDRTTDGLATEHKKGILEELIERLKQRSWKLQQEAK